MAINYRKVNDGQGWARGVPFNPTNAQNMEMVFRLPAME